MDSNSKKRPFAQLLMKEPPHTYLLIFVILIICAVLTYIVPAGQFETAVNEIRTRNTDTRDISKGRAEPRESLSIF